MGNFDRDIAARLRDSAGVQAVMASDAALGRRAIDWRIRPDGAGLPAVILRRVAIQPDYDQASRGGFEGTIVQVDAFATTYVAAVRILGAIRGELEASNTTGDTVFSRSFINSGPRDLDAEDVGAQRTHRVSADFLIYSKPA